MEGAACGHILQGRHGTRDLEQPLAGLTHLGQRVDQPLGIGMLGIIDDFAGGPLLNDSAGIHHQHALSDLRHHTEIVSDQHQRHVVLLAQLQQQRHDFRLNRHIQGRRRFIGDDDLRVQQQCDGDDNALAHAARQFMGVLIQALVRRRNLYLPQLVQGDIPGRPGADPAMRLERFHHLGANGQHRVQGHHRVLENHGDAVAANLAQFPLAHGCQVLTLEQDLASGNVTGPGDQVEKGESRYGFTRARFPHQPQALALVETETDASQGGKVPTSHGEAGNKIVYFQ